jgi:transposase-like protein
MPVTDVRKIGGHRSGVSTPKTQASGLKFGYTLVQVVCPPCAWMRRSAMTLEIALSCKNCNYSFTVLLMQMAEQDGKMVCPKCGVTSRYHFADLQKCAA